jgi:hypothetical protein
MAQDTARQRELGLVLYGFDHFGFSYKTGSAQSLWRFKTLFSSGSTMKEESENKEIKYGSNAVGISIGKEFRSKLMNNLEFRYGADISFQYSINKNQTNITTNPKSVFKNTDTRYTPGINAVIGLNYVLKDRFVIGAELLPYFSYYTGKSKNETSNDTNNSSISSNISGFNYGLNISYVLISFAYRF